MKVFCTLTKEQASLYAAVVEETAERIEASEGIQRKGVVLATLIEAQAGLQPSRPSSWATTRRSPAARASWRG